MKTSSAAGPAVMLMALITSAGLLIPAQTSAADGMELSAPVVAPGVPPLTPKVHVFLSRCGGPPNLRCGRAELPLNRDNPDGRTIKIGFMLFRHTDRSKPALEPIVAQEGGPGYGSTYSRSYYKGLYAPIMDRHDLLMIDARGTGRSSSVDCPWLQSLHYRDYDQWVDAVGACGRRLGNASDLYSTAHAADDMADIIHALGYEKVNVYGDSYGTFFSQTFAVRHPGMLRSLVLDAAYPVEGQDVWQRDWIAAQVDGYRNVCERDPGCSGDPIARLTTLLDQIRATPIKGRAANDDGGVRDVVIDPGVMAYIFTSAGYNYSNYRDFDAAVKAALNGDDLPMLRLARNSLYLGGGGALHAYSQGLANAVSCTDYPQPYDIQTPLNTRQAQWDSAVADLEKTDPNAFFPFTVHEMVTSPIEDFDSCMRWPVSNALTPPMPPGHAWPDVPTLVMVGDLDSVTSSAGSQKVAEQFPNSTFVHVPNVTHVTALADHKRCTSKIVLSFTENLDAGDASCVDTRYPEVRAVDEFYIKAADIPANTTEERAALVAIESVGDAIARWYNMYGSHGTGLRGGTFVVHGYGRPTWTLDKVRFVTDVRVSGHAELDRRSGEGSADMTLAGPGVPPSDLHLAWNDYDLNSMATVTGTVGRARVHLSVPAPSGI